MNKLRSFSGAGLAAIAIAAIVAVACDQPQQPVVVESRLLVVDGIEIRFADVEPFLPYIDEFQPNAGQMVKIQRVLDTHVLPVFAARRAFAAQRREQLEKARALCSVATNVYELDKQSELMTHRKRRNQTRLHPALPVGQFLFDALKTGSVSPPIEVSQGWIVASAFELHETQLTTTDYVDGLQVGFVTHTDGEWHAWYDAERARLADKATFVHPEFRAAMPEWIQLPKQP